MSHIRIIRFRSMMLAYRNWKAAINYKGIPKYAFSPKEIQECKNRFHYWKKSYLETLKKDGLHA